MQVRHGIAKVNKSEIQYFSFGSGEKIMIMLAGLSLKNVVESAQVIANSYSMFEKDFTVYCIERLDNPPKGYKIIDIAKDTIEVIKSLNIDSAYFFGTSQGGAIAQQIALLRPKMVKKLCIAASFSRGNKRTKKVIGKWISLSDKLKVQELNHNVFKNIYTKEFYKKHKKAFNILEKDGTDLECKRFSILARACIGFNIYDELEKIKCPTFVIGTKNDKVVTGKATEEIAEKLNCKFFMYEKYAHSFYDEAPDFKDKLYNFLMNK